MRNVLFNLLPYRGTPTGLSRYVERLLIAWPYQDGGQLQLRIHADGHAELSRNFSLPQIQHSAAMRWLQANALVQHAVPVRRLVAQANADLIYSPYTDRLLSLPAISQVITCHDLIPLFFPNSRRAYLRTRYWLPIHLRGAARVIAISRSVADILVKTGIPAEQIDLVYNGIESIENPLRSPSTGDVLVIARHARNKNLRAALEGFACFLGFEPSWEGDLVIVGPPDRDTSDLQRLASDLEINPRIRWIPSLDQAGLEKQIRNSFCLVSSSLMEGFDYPLLEAQNFGLPTLASDIPVHAELHAQNAILFHLGDSGSSLAYELRRLARDQSCWKHLSEAGLANARKFTLERQVKGIIKLLKDVRL